MVQGGWHWQNSTSHSLHVTGPRHCPRVDKPHPASITSTRPAQPALLSPGAPGNRLRRWCRIVPVSPTGTRGSFPRIFSTGMTYSTGFLWSSWYKIWDLIEFNHPAKTKDIIYIIHINIIYIIHIICIIRIIHIMHIIHITRIIDIIHLIHITTIFRIIVCFHRRHKCTVGGHGPSVCLSRGWVGTGAILGHTRLFPATQQKLHCRFLAA